jgi:hypothetical protein
VTAENLRPDDTPAPAPDAERCPVTVHIPMPGVPNLRWIEQCRGVDGHSGPCGDTMPGAWDLARYVARRWARKWDRPMTVVRRRAQRPPTEGGNR